MLMINEMTYDRIRDDTHKVITIIFTYRHKNRALKSCYAFLGSF